ncbi:dihydrofolate reductase family protein [Pedococcus aerophilus]|uniref:dihydrofolate reductase family protein n=1 Tax=Pedococcus aerophilus TaxID=436356 RepID=UPI0031D2B7EA
MILTTTASVDGRITLSAGERLLEPDVGARWGAAWPADVQDLVDQRRTWIEDRHAPTVVLEGSGTFVATEAESPWSQDDSAHGGSLHRDHLPRRAPRWFVVVDGRGRVDWTYTGDDETALLVLVCEATPAGYLRRLRDLGVGHLVAGVERVDLRLALERLYAVLGVRAVVADGGGGVNGALIGDGLVDEVHVITFPVLIGGLTTPTFNDGAGLDPGGSPVRLLPRGLVRGDHGSTWARYDVARG